MFSIFLRILLLTNLAKRHINKEYVFIIMDIIN